MTVNNLIFAKSMNITVQKPLGTVIRYFSLSINNIILFTQLETYSNKANVNTTIRPVEKIGLDLKMLIGLV